MAEVRLGNTWQETKRNIEYFLQGKHLQSDGWDGPGSYEYIPDSKVFGSDIAHDLPRCQFRVKSLIHATTPEAASDIVTKGELLPNFKVLLGEEGLYLIWWGLALEVSDINKYTKQCRKFASAVERDRQAIEQQADVDSLTNQFETLGMEEWMDNFCSSAPFVATKSRYGNIMFEYSPDELLREYSSQVCEGKEPSFRVMGTFAYKQEVMHAVLVCPPTTYEEIFPPVNENTRVIFKQDGVWVWNPETTSDILKFEFLANTCYRRWENATFAFVVPKDHSFKLNNSDMHISYCVAADVFRLHTKRNRKKWTFEETLDFLHEYNILQPIQLLSMIHKHIVQVLRLKVNMQDDRIECWACSNESKIRPSFLQTLLKGESGQYEQLSYCPHELHQMVRKAATQRWELWVREMTHYLPTE